MTAAAADAACAAAFGRASGASDARVIPQRRVLLSCRRLLGRDGVVAYDVDRQSVAWKIDTRAYVDSAAAEQHFFAISSSTTPPTGLQAGRTIYTVHAMDLITGRTRWRAEVPIASAVRDDSLRVVEGLSGIPEHPLSAVVSFGDGTTSYDQATGAQLWHVPRAFDSPASGSYITGGVVEISGYQDNSYGDHLTGFDARTGNLLWDLRFPSPCNEVEASYVTGTIEWRAGPRCMTRHDVLTGQLVSMQGYPPAWRNIYADPNGIVAMNGSSLAFYLPDDLANPVWSVSADPSTTPLAISSKHVLVAASSGGVLLSRADGSLVTRVSSEFLSDLRPPAKDGLLIRAEDLPSDFSALSMDPS